jgi:outer membrane protein
MKTLLKFLAVMVLALCAASVFAGDLRVGYVDTERILRDSEPAVKAGQRIEKEFSARDQEIRKLAAQVKDLQEDLAKKGDSLPVGERRSRKRELAGLSARLQRKQRKFREDLNQRKNEELSALLEQANKVIQNIAEKEKYDLILQEAVYRNPQIDITDKVLKALAGGK